MRWLWLLLPAAGAVATGVWVWRNRPAARRKLWDSITTWRHEGTVPEHWDVALALDAELFPDWIGGRGGTAVWYDGAVPMKAGGFANGTVLEFDSCRLGLGSVRVLFHERYHVNEYRHGRDRDADPSPAWEGAALAEFERRVAEEART